MQVNDTQTYNKTKAISYKARWVKNAKYKAASEGANFRHIEKSFIEEKILEGEKLLSTFPEHKLKLKNEGIQNLTTKKYYKFPEIDEENSHFANLMYFYSMLKEKGNKFIETLFSK